MIRAQDQEHDDKLESETTTGINKIKPDISDSQDLQPLHQNPLKYNPIKMNPMLRANKQLNSPTDMMFSPATQKVEQKRNHLFKKYRIFIIVKSRL